MRAAFFGKVAVLLVYYCVQGNAQELLELSSSVATRQAESSRGAGESSRGANIGGLPTAIPGSGTLPSTTTWPGVSCDHSGEGNAPRAAVERKRESTPFALFSSAVVASFALTLVTEFGDRTFFIAAIMSLRHSKAAVLSGSVLALVIQTVFSVTAGRLFHLLPGTLDASSFLALPLDDYAAAGLFFVFGLLHLRSALQAENNTQSAQDEEHYRALGRPEEDEESRQRGGDPRELGRSCCDGGESSELRFSSELRRSTGCISCGLRSPGRSGAPSSDSTCASCDDANHRDAHHRDSFFFERRECERGQSTLLPHKTAAGAAVVSSSAAAAAAASSSESIAPVSSSESTAAVFRNAFCVTFVAELGDKSMFSTVALAAAQNPYGVFVGSSVAHSIVTSVAVLSGFLLGGRISERWAHAVGAALFFVFAALATLEGLARQGIRLWWFLRAKISAVFVAYWLTRAGSATASGPVIAADGFANVPVP